MTDTIRIVSSPHVETAGISLQHLLYGISHLGNIQVAVKRHVGNATSLKDEIPFWGVHRTGFYQ